MTRKATILDRKLRDDEKLTTRCLHCRWWKFRGSAEEGMVASREHRRLHHPELPEVSPRLNRRMVPR